MPCSMHGFALVGGDDARRRDDFAAAFGLRGRQLEVDQEVLAEQHVREAAGGAGDRAGSRCSAAEHAWAVGEHERHAVVGRVRRRWRVRGSRSSPCRSPAPSRWCNPGCCRRSRSREKPARAPSSREKSSLTITMRASICTWRIGISSVPTRRRMSSRRSAESCSSSVLVRSSTDTVPRLDSRPPSPPCVLISAARSVGLRVVDLQIFRTQRRQVLHVRRARPARPSHARRVLRSVPR